MNGPLEGDRALLEQGDQVHETPTFLLAGKPHERPPPKPHPRTASQTRLTLFSTYTAFGPPANAAGTKTVSETERAAALGQHHSRALDVIAVAKVARAAIMTSMMTAAPLDQLVQFASALTVAAGDMALTDFGTASSRRKANGSEVTSTDLAVQEMMARRIVERYPDHAVIGEETLESHDLESGATHARYCWVIDPVDGTRNYVRRFPIMATSVALLEEGRPVVGVVRWHHTAQLFAATEDGEATLDENRLHVSQRPVDADMLIGAQLGASHATGDVVLPWANRWAIRNLGATAIHLALVASGGLDAAYAKDCRIWDLAAGALLIERAGGCCTGPHGEPLFPVDPAHCAKLNLPFVAGAPGAHRAIIEDIATRGF
jgi:myo-inositol-1(or 4)-monophosphatase